MRSTLPPRIVVGPGTLPSRVPIDLFVTVTFKFGNVTFGIALAGRFSNGELVAVIALSPDLNNIEGVWGGVDIWAPEVHKFGDRYYLFVTFPGRKKGRGTQILSADRPQGPFTVNGDNANTPPDQQCLDGTPFIARDGTRWLVYCNEWTDVKNGTLRAVRMTNDWTARQGDSMLLFRASEAPWVRPYRAGHNEFVTDGPFFHRTKGGKLLMIWSSFRQGGNYAVGVAESESGTVTGPWSHSKDVLYGADGGHGMIFRDFANNLLLVLHSPNGDKRERAQLLKLIEENDRLRVAP